MDVWTKLKPNLDVQWMSCAVWTIHIKFANRANGHIYRIHHWNIFFDKIEEFKSLRIANSLALIWWNAWTIRKILDVCYIQRLFFDSIYIDKRRREYSTFLFNSAIWRVHGIILNLHVYVNGRLTEMTRDTSPVFTSCFSQKYITFIHPFTVTLLS